MPVTPVRYKSRFMHTQAQAMSSAVSRVMRHCRDKRFIVPSSDLVAFPDAVADGVVAQRRPQLFAQGRDMYPDGVAEAVHAAVPDVLDQLFLTDRASLMQQQIFQYAALLPRQGKGLTIHRGNAAAGVEAEPPAAQADVLLDELRRVRLRTRASSSARWNGLER